MRFATAFGLSTAMMLPLPQQAAAQAEVIFRSQPEIPPPGKCTGNVIPRAVLRKPKIRNDRQHEAFFGHWCRVGPQGPEEIAIVADDTYTGEKKSHVVKLYYSTVDGKVQQAFGVMVWDKRQKRWSFFSGQFISWLQSNGNLAYGKAKRSGPKFRVPKGKKAGWGSYRKVR